MFSGPFVYAKLKCDNKVNNGQQLKRLQIMKLHALENLNFAINT